MPMLDAFFVTIKPDMRQGLIESSAAAQIPLQPVQIDV